MVFTLSQTTVTEKFILENVYFLLWLRRPLPREPICKSLSFGDVVILNKEIILTLTITLIVNYPL